MFSGDFFKSWGYLGIFLGIIATGLGFPMPEEVPVIFGGVLVGIPENALRWWLMLPVCIVGVIIGDGFLYTIGRLWGPRLKEYRWVKKHLLPPERLQRIEHNFHTYGIKILLFARLTPGVRAPIFVTAGITRIPLYRFLIADGLYAIPGVSLLFFLGYWFADQLSSFSVLKENIEWIKSILILVVIAAVVGYFIYRLLRRPHVTGDPHEMPHLVEQVVEQVSTKIILPKKGHAEEPPAKTEAPPTNHQPPPDGLPRPADAPEVAGLPPKEPGPTP